MSKSIVVKGVAFEFGFDEGSNIWRVWGCKSILNEHAVDLEVDLNNFPDNSFNWDHIQSFLDYLVSNQEGATENTIAGQHVLHALLKEVGKPAFTEDDLNNIQFEPGMIDFKGVRQSFSSQYKYDIVFSPFDQRNEYRDLGSTVWRASFVSNQLAGVMREI